MKFTDVLASLNSSFRIFRLTRIVMLPSFRACRNSVLQTYCPCPALIRGPAHGKDQAPKEKHYGERWLSAGVRSAPGIRTGNRARWFRTVDGLVADAGRATAQERG